MMHQDKNNRQQGFAHSSDPERGHWHDHGQSHGQCHHGSEHQQVDGQSEQEHPQSSGHEMSCSSTCRYFDELVAIVAQLRGENGCPWDRKQTHESIARNLIEEAYETVEVIEEGKPDSLREELGDVLLQVLLHAQIAQETGEFSLDDVIVGIARKLISRHPHVFGNEASFAAAGYTDEEIALIQNAANAEDTLKVWDRMKLLEHQRKQSTAGAAATEGSSLLDSVPKSEPALMQAQNISRKAAAQGFEWEDIEGLTDKLAEEFEEFALAEADTRQAEEEFGDILFTLVNIARWNNIDAETALRRANEKFRIRWAEMEKTAADEDFDLRGLDPQEWNELWNEVKERIQ